jgi:hypothetical protein
MSACYFFEVYTKGPAPHYEQEGWDIKVGLVYDCPNRKTAVERVKQYFGDEFDEVILCHESLAESFEGKPNVYHVH